MTPGPADLKGAVLHRRLGMLLRDGDVALSRGHFFAALVAIGFANGISEKVARQAAEFGISVIVWGALVAALVLLARAGPDPIRRADVAVTAAAAGAFLLPIPDLSWLAIAGLAVHLFRSTNRPARRAAAIVLALTIPMFWARALMAAFGNLVLEVDATFVAWVVGTQRNGNVVPFADGSGSLWIAPGCSSFAGVSLAVLCTVTFVQMLDRRWSASVVLWGLAACLAVVVVNTLRIGLIGLYPPGFDLFHGPVGANVAAWITTAAILGLCHFGIGRNAPTSG
jgi:hypothetical protein